MYVVRLFSATHTIKKVYIMNKWLVWTPVVGWCCFCLCFLVSFLPPPSPPPPPPPPPSFPAAQKSSSPFATTQNSPPAPLPQHKNSPPAPLPQHKIVLHCTPHYKSVTVLTPSKAKSNMKECPSNLMEHSKNSFSQHVPFSSVFLDFFLYEHLSSALSPEAPKAPPSGNYSLLPLSASPCSPIMSLHSTLTLQNLVWNSSPPSSPWDSHPVLLHPWLLGQVMSYCQV